MGAAVAILAAVACVTPGIVDGDTLRCGGERVRLFGIDAPERHGPSHGATFPAEPPAGAGADAARALARLTPGRVVCIEATPRDRYGRLVARCSSLEPGGARDLGAAMVQAGWAVDWPRYSHGAYADDQAAARAAARGIWSRAPR